MHLAASLAEMGKIDEAHAAFEKALQLQPACLINFIRRQFGQELTGNHNAVQTLTEAP